MIWIQTAYHQLRDYPYKTLLILFVFCVAAYLATIPLPRVDGMLIGSDGVGYYMYVRSLVIDRDLNFANEYSRLAPETDLTPLITQTGMIANQYAVGSGILWMPFFVVAHLLALGLQGLGLPTHTDGYSYLYQAATCLGSIVYGFLGILLTFQAVQRLYPATALAAVLLIWLASNLIYYLIVEPSMSHMCSFFAVALLIHVWLRSRPLTRWRDCFTIGLAGGLVGIVRQPDVTFLLLPMIDCFLDRDQVFRKGQRLSAMLGGFLLVFWIQMAVWQVLYGNPFTSGYFFTGQQGFNWWSPRLIEVLFSLEHGLFAWHPVLFLAAIGLVHLRRLDQRLTVLFISGVLLQAYIIASWSSWWQGDSFGGRMFIASLPVFTFGVAAFWQWAITHHLSGVLWPVSVGLIGWNALFLIQYRMGFIPMSGPYTLSQLTIGKFEMIAELGARMIDMLTR